MAAQSVVKSGASCGLSRKMSGVKRMNKVNLGSLLDGDTDIDIAIFTSCDYCGGRGVVNYQYRGGPWGLDQTLTENCAHCHKEYGAATGKRLVKVPLSELVSYIVKALGNDPVG